MTEKECFKCGVTKPLSEFYKHPQMGDGHLGKCKECTKTYVRSNRRENIDRYRAYDRERGSRQPKGYCSEYREKFPNKYKAHGIVARAIRAGKLFIEPCEVCFTTDQVHAHHDDYLKPLNIRWICAGHHSQWHKENGEGLNG